MSESDSSSRVDELGEHLVENVSKLKISQNDSLAKESFETPEGEVSQTGETQTAKKTEDNDDASETKNGSDSEYETPTGDNEGEQEPFLDDIVDEEQLKVEEETLTPEQLQARHEESKTFKQQGNLQFGNGEFRESVSTYTKGLRICPLKEKEFRSVLYANRSAAKIKLNLNHSAIDDCSQAITNNPTYVRALLRRAKLYDQLDKLDEALADYQKVIELDPGVPEARAALVRLPEQINERNEKLKTEMLGKLKDLGNLILKPFGLSTDSFQLNQDPSGSGGYSINFKK